MPLGSGGAQPGSPPSAPKVVTPATPTERTALPAPNAPIAEARRAARPTASEATSEGGQFPSLMPAPPSHRPPRSSLAPKESGRGTPSASSESSSLGPRSSDEDPNARSGPLAGTQHWVFDTSGLAPLHQAVLADPEDLPRVEALLRQNASPFLRARPPRGKTTDYSGHSALSLATRRERQGTLRLLVLGAAGAYLRSAPVPERSQAYLDGLLEWSMHPLRHGDELEKNLIKLSNLDVPSYLWPTAAQALGEIARTGLHSRLEWLFERADRPLLQLHEDLSYVEARLFAIGGLEEAPYVGRMRHRLHERARREGVQIGASPDLAYARMAAAQRAAAEDPAIQRPRGDRSQSGPAALAGPRPSTAPAETASVQRPWPQRLLPRRSAERAPSSAK